MEAAVDEGFAFVAMARALLREPDLINRMRADADVKAGTRMPFAFKLDKAVLFDPGSGLRL